MNLIIRLYEFMKRQFLLVLSHWVKRSKYSKVVLLAGSGRSGTTWIGDLINHRNNFRVLFEPFHPEHVPDFSAYQSRQYLRKTNTNPEYLDPLNRLLEGEVSNRWVNSRNKNPNARKLLIKEIRANLLLRWIKERHPEIRIVLVLRHPCAVALSRLKLGWGGTVDHFLNQPELMEDYLRGFEQTLQSAGSDLLKAVAAWCVENYVPLRQFHQGEILVCYYENFILDPAKEVGKLMKFINEPFPENLDAILKTASDTNWNRKDHTKRQIPALNEWKHEFPAGEYELVKEILRKFGMDDFYDEDGFPLSPELKRDLR